MSLLFVVFPPVDFVYAMQRPLLAQLLFLREPEVAGQFATMTTVKGKKTVQRVQVSVVKATKWIGECFLCTVVISLNIEIILILIKPQIEWIVVIFVVNKDPYSLL